MNFNKLINFNNLKKEAKLFKKNKPFNYLVVDDFFESNFAKKLESEIPNYNDNICRNANFLQKRIKPRIAEALAEAQGQDCFPSP